MASSTAAASFGARQHPQRPQSPQDQKRPSQTEARPTAAVAADAIAAPALVEVVPVSPELEASRIAIRNLHEIAGTSTPVVDLVKAVLDVINHQALDLQEKAITGLKKLDTKTIINLAKAAQAGPTLDTDDRLKLIVFARPHLHIEETRVHADDAELYALVKQLLQKVYEDNQLDLHRRPYTAEAAEDFAQLVFDNNQYLRIVPIEGMGEGVIALPRTDGKDIQILYTGRKYRGTDYFLTEVELRYVLPTPDRYVRIVGTSSPALPVLAGPKINDLSWNTSLEGRKAKLEKEVGHLIEARRNYEDTQALESQRAIVRNLFSKTAIIYSIQATKCRLDEAVAQERDGFMCCVAPAKEAPRQLSKQYGSNYWLEPVFPNLLHLELSAAQNEAATRAELRLGKLDLVSILKTETPSEDSEALLAVHDVLTQNPKMFIDTWRCVTGKHPLYREAVIHCEGIHRL